MHTLNHWTIQFPILCALLALQGCGITGDDPSGPESRLPPTLNGNQLFPLPVNLPPGDSTLADLSRGTIASLQPGGSYELHLGGVNPSNAPVLHLYIATAQEDRVRYDYLQSVSASTDTDGSTLYSFAPEIRQRSDVFTVLEAKDGNYYDGGYASAELTGTGEGSESFSVNLILVGEVGKWRDSAQVLADSILTALRGVYGDIGISVDTVRVLKAEEHPLHGSDYPADAVYEYSYSSDDLSALSEYLDPDVRSGLDLALVRNFDSDGILGVSPIPGYTLGAGAASTVVLAAYSTVDGVEEAASAHGIAATAIHEIGHFLGLRHTTSTNLDLQSYLDYSLIEDGFGDTPYCSWLRGGSGVALNGLARIRISAAGGSAISLCPDRENLMFPVALDGVESRLLSETQGAALRRNLSLLPR